MRILLFLSLILLAHSAMAQTVTVRDKLSTQPIESATLTSDQPKGIAITGSNGQVDISSLKGSPKISVQSVGYRPIKISYAELAALDFRLSMEEAFISLDELVISANRWEQDSREIPVHISKIKPADVALQNPQTAADMLAISGEVYVQKSQLGGGSPMIRGFSTNRLLIAVDGVRMNNAIFRSGNLQNVISIDPFTLEETEVLFGPGSVMYGSDAIGGVMDFHTVTPRVGQSNQACLSGNAVFRYASANNEQTAHLDLAYGKGEWGFVTSLSRFDFDDLKMGSNGPDDYLRPEYVRTLNGQDEVVVNPDPEKQVATDYNQISLMQKIRFQPSEELDIQYGFYYSATGDVPRYDRLVEYSDGVLRSAEWYYGPQVWMMNNLKIAHSPNAKLYDNARLIIAHQYFQESRNDRRFGRDGLRMREEQVNALTFNLDLDKQISDRQSLYYGAEVVTNLVNSTGVIRDINSGTEEPTSTRYPDGSRWNSYAAYMNYRYRASEKATLQAGLRYSHVNSSSTFDRTFFPLPFTTAEVNTGAFNGSLGLAYRPADTWQINANISTGFRAPNIDDIGKIFDSEPGAIIVPNPDLSPEYAYNYEIGISKIIAGKLKLEGTAYYTRLADAMVRRDYQLNGQDSILYDGEMSKVLAIQNAAKANVYGFQLGFDWQLVPNWTLVSRLNIQNGEEQDEETGKYVPLRHAAPTFGMTKLVYTIEKLRIEANVQYNGSFSFDDLAPSEQGKVDIYALDEQGLPFVPSWYTINLKATYQAIERLQFNVGVENLTNQRYRPYSSGISAAGLNFIASANVRF
ncbi:MAG: TonB-dependent receptor [Cyclobacteriaceae bacterium]